MPQHGALPCRAPSGQSARSLRQCWRGVEAFKQPPAIHDRQGPARKLLPRVQLRRQPHGASTRSLLMLTTQQPIFRRFWHAVMPLSQLADGPQPFTLLGENIVLFLDEHGQPAALKDRCCHRTAKLSKGWCNKGRLQCGYHGWVYDRTGRVVE